MEIADREDREFDTIRKDGVRRGGEDRESIFC